VRSYIPLLMASNCGLTKNDHPTGQPQDQGFQTVKDAGWDEAIHPIFSPTKLSIMQHVVRMQY
jgi:hypothetical protein